MARERMKHSCECQCGGEDYFNALVEVVVEEAIDDTLRQTHTAKRFRVLRKCKEAFEEELAMMQLLKQLVLAYPPPAQTRWWLINAWLNPLYPWPRILRSWWRRVGAAVKVMKLQHAIFERTRGFEYARRRAMQSAILFGCPRFMQAYLTKRFVARALAEKAKEEKRGIGPKPTVVAVQAEA